MNTNSNSNENQLTIKTNLEIEKVKSTLETFALDSCNLSKKEKLLFYIKNNIAKTIIPFRNSQSLSKEKIAHYLEIKVSELGQIISKSGYKWVINKRQYIPISEYSPNPIRQSFRVKKTKGPKKIKITLNARTYNIFNGILMIENKKADFLAEELIQNYANLKYQNIFKNAEVTSSSITIRKKKKQIIETSSIEAF